MQKGEWSLWGVAELADIHTCREVLWSWVVLQKHKKLLFLFSSTDMLPNRHNDQVLLHQTQGEKKKKRETGIPADTTNIYVLYFSPPSLASCLPGNTTGAKTAACGHLLTSIPNGSLPLWQMLYCFDSLLQLFHVGTCGVHDGNGVSGSFHPDAVFGVSASQFEPQTWWKADDDTVQRIKCSEYLKWLNADWLTLWRLWRCLMIALNLFLLHFL